MNETDKVTGRIMIWLSMNGYPSWRVGANPVPGRRLRITSRGIGDIITIIRPSGRHCEIEVKMGADKPRKAQIEHAERIEEAGAVHLFVKSFEDFLAQFEKVPR